MPRPARHCPNTHCPPARCPPQGDSIKLLIGLTRSLAVPGQSHSTLQLSALEPSALEVGTIQVGVTEVGVRQVGIAQVPGAMRLGPCPMPAAAPLSGFLDVGIAFLPVCLYSV
nr:hypothetical protein [Oscillatoria sp. PCC 10802]